MNLNRVAPFVAVADLESFRGAARRLGVSPAAVSKAIAALEGELGVALFDRTSRRVSLTAEGALLVDHCRAALDRLQAGEDLVTQAASVAEGRVRVSLSYVLARPLVAQLHRLVERYPRLEVQLCFTDTFVDLIADDIDVALRLGDLPDSSLVARRLRPTTWRLVASPAYLARRGSPAAPAALGDHTCLRFANPSGRIAPWTLRDGPIDAAMSIVMDDGNALVDGALAGLGIAQPFDFMVDHHLREGRLVELFADRRPDGPPLWAVCLPRRQAIPRVRAALDFLARTLAPPPR